MAEILQFPSKMERMERAAAAGRIDVSSARQPLHASLPKPAMPPKRAFGRLLMSTAVRSSATAPNLA
jgi:hypothetical protein